MSVRGVSKDLLRLCAGEPVKRVNMAKIDSVTSQVFYCDKAFNQVKDMKEVIKNGKLCFR